MKNEEIVKQLKYISTLWRNGCGGLGALDELIDTLSPKPQFVLGPAKYADGNDCNILAIHTDDVEGMITEYKDCGKWLSRWHRLDGETLLGSKCRRVLPNAPGQEKGTKEVE